MEKKRCRVALKELFLYIFVDLDLDSSKEVSQVISIKKTELIKSICITLSTYISVVFLHKYPP